VWKNLNRKPRRLTRRSRAKPSSKLLTFQWIFKKRNDWRLASIQPEIKLPLKYSLFGSDSEKTLFEAEPPGRFLKEKNIPPIREFRPFGTSGTFFLDCHSRNQNQ
jgi:hypothetical protein